MRTNYQLVTDFNKAMGLAEPNAPVGFSSEQQKKLRHDLIVEEAITERLEAREADELYKVMDAHGDSLVVLYGEANDYKFDSDIVLAIVNYANMSKVCKTPEEAHESVMAYGLGKHPDKMGEVLETHWDAVEVGGVDMFVVYNSLTGKGLKSVNFRPPEQDLKVYAKVLVSGAVDPEKLRTILRNHGVEALIESLYRVEQELTNYKN
ncbi:hypothetical protein ACRXCV_00345 (plasmid) [Halobacteriovorax sp. GFR7]|uniref:hypothetical protein n=1 Tax=unclassified Halobacteriovorax TaxID=2639665 RepID=UPI003D9955D8